MGKPLTYNDAVRVLGGQKSRLITVLDAVATTGLTAWTAGALVAGQSAEAPLSLLELKEEVVQYGRHLMTRISEWKRGITRFDRSQRLLAAHAVLVVSSFFEELGEANLPVPLRELHFTAEEEIGLATGAAIPDRYAEVIDLLVRQELPFPEVQRPFNDTCFEIRRYYESVSERVSRFVSGLALFEKLPSRKQRDLREKIAMLPRSALLRYEAAYRNLAVDNKEFEVWANLNEVRALGAGLSRIATLLSSMEVRQVGQRSRAHLLRSYSAALDEPILSRANAPDGVILPSLGAIYVNPHCKVAEIGQGDTPADREWWESQNSVTDIETFLAGYITSPRAVEAPLVVLGEPGSGKSTFTEVLAAQLSGQDFIPIRVSLREVAAESLIQAQIEQAIYQGPADRVAWHDLLESVQGALPIVMLDGFDELLQASGTNRYNYLEQVQEFQRNQARIGHPVVAIVTTRTVVADHARFPLGTIALELLPFNREQVRRWLEVWGEHNKAILSERGLKPLTWQTADSHHDLTEHPLLLLLLALFDATNNALQRMGRNLGRSALYEALLVDFGLREVRKSSQNRSLPDMNQRELVERELHDLSIVALGMFTRGSQFISETELDDDLSILSPEQGGKEGDRVTLSPSQRITGRFFFIHRSETRLGGDRARSYEFLHPTFSEYLVARLTVRALRDLAALRELSLHGPTSANRLDDGFLYAVSSFSVLAERTPIINFLSELLSTLSGERDRLRTLLITLMANSLYLHSSRSYEHYEPVRYSITRRLASFTANLTVLLVLVAGEIECRDIFGVQNSAKKWVECARLWHAEFNDTEWNGVLDTIRVRISREEDQIAIRLVREDASQVSFLGSVVLTSQLSSKDLTHYELLVSGSENLPYDFDVPASSTVGRILRAAAFIPNYRTGLLLLQAIPSIRALGPRLRSQLDSGAVSPAYFLGHLDYTRDATAEVRAAGYVKCAQMVGDDPEFCAQLLMRLHGELQSIDLDGAVEAISYLHGAPPTDLYVRVVDYLWARSENNRKRQQEILNALQQVKDRPEDGTIRNLRARLADNLRQDRGMR